MSRREDARWELFDIYEKCGYRVHKINLRRGPLGLGWIEDSHLIDPSGRTYAIIGGGRSKEYLAAHQALTLRRLVAHVREMYRTPASSREAR